DEGQTKGSKGSVGKTVPRSSRLIGQRDERDWLLTGCGNKVDCFKGGLDHLDMLDNPPIPSVVITLQDKKYGRQVGPKGFAGCPPRQRGSAGVRADTSCLIPAGPNR